MTKYTVVGLYEADFHPFVNWVEVSSAKEAINKVLLTRGDYIIIAGVFGGHLVSLEGEGTG